MLKTSGARICVNYSTNADNGIEREAERRRQTVGAMFR
jgi:hypothetical protein